MRSSSPMQNLILFQSSMTSMVTPSWLLSAHRLGIFNIILSLAYVIHVKSELATRCPMGSTAAPQQSFQFNELRMNAVIFSCGFIMWLFFQIYQMSDLTNFPDTVKGYVSIV